MAATTFNGVTGGGTVVNTVNGISFKPDMVWMKSRNSIHNHEIADSVRGTPYASFPNLTNAEVSDTRVSAFNSNGFGFGTNSNCAVTGDTEVAWQWQAGQGTNVSNTSGSITSTVSVNTTAGFSVVTYTGNATNGATVGHGLGVSPSMIIGKIRSTTGDWYVWQTAMGDNVMRLNTTAAQIASTGNGVYNTASFSSTVFALGSGTSMNTNAATYVAYCWAAVAGYSAFGSYTGNGSADGPFVYLGFRPRWVMVKRSDSAGFDWVIGDSSRNTYNVVNDRLFADASLAEDTTDNWVDFTSNGFKLRSTNTNQNASGGTYIYACFAENPFRISNAR